MTQPFDQFTPIRPICSAVGGDHGCLSIHSRTLPTAAQKNQPCPPNCVTSPTLFILQLVLGPYLELNLLATMGPEWAGGRNS